MSGKKNTLIQLMLEKHLTIWNEPDIMVRQAAIPTLYAPEIKITTPEDRYKGIEAANNAIESFRQANPGALLKFDGAPAMHHNGTYYHWSLIKDNQPIAKGIDFIMFKDGLIKSIFIFTD